MRERLGFDNACEFFYVGFLFTYLLESLTTIFGLFPVKLPSYTDVSTAAPPLLSKSFINYYSSEGAKAEFELFR